jgi:catechol 2,3-dioxygenase-like lactoylglutathione lyase family enzyme
MRLVFAIAVSIGLSACATQSATQTATQTATLPSPATADSAPVASDYDGVYFKRVALVVADMDRALTIYRDLLGLELNGVTQSKPTSYSYPVFNIDKDATIRFATFNAGPDQTRTLALSEVTGMTIDNQNTPHSAALVLNANGRFDSILAGALAMGLHVVDPVPLDAGDSRGVGREAAFVDYDGHLIVIYEFPFSDAPNKN